VRGSPAESGHQAGGELLDGRGEAQRGVVGAAAQPLQGGRQAVVGQAGVRLEEVHHAPPREQGQNPGPVLRHLAPTQSSRRQQGLSNGPPRQQQRDSHDESGAKIGRPERAAWCRIRGSVHARCRPGRVLVMNAVHQ
jgi:hypothetical protein